MELYLRNIARRWKSEIVGLPAKKYVFSPYVTSGTAESVLASIAGEACEIYTLFSAELFASKASSLRTIKKLASYGHQLFALPDLHAKIILVPGAFATIGSQNLTANGTRKKEASVLIRDEKQLLKIEREIMHWMEDRVLITPEMIDDMEVLLKGVETKFEDYNKAIEAVNHAVHEKQRQREEESLAIAQEALRQEEVKRREALRLEASRLEAKRQLGEHLRQMEAEREQQARIAHQEQAERESRLQSLTYNMRSVQTSLSTADGVVSKVREAQVWSPYDDRYSLLSQYGRDLTMWSVGGKQVELTRANRYLIIHKSGRLGWARVMRSRITFVASSIHGSDEHFLAGHLLQFSVEADWSEVPQYGRNVVFKLTDSMHRLADCTISTWFDLDNLTLLKIDKPEYVNPDSIEHNEAIEDISKGWPEIREYCLTRILRSFKYIHNLTGDDASEFFGREGDRISLSATLIANNPVLMCR